MDETDTVSKIPMTEDFLFAWSTFSGFVAYRNPGCGSCYIQTLCLFLDRLGTKYHLEDILKLVRYTIAQDFESAKGRKQMPNTDSTLTGRIYFHPKRLGKDAPRFLPTFDNLQ